MLPTGPYIEMPHKRQLQVLFFTPISPLEITNINATYGFLANLIT